MLSNELISKAMSLGANEKNAFLEKLLVAVGSLEDTVTSRKPISESLMAQSRAATDEIKKILNDNVQRIEKKNVELRKKINDIMKDTSKLDELNDSMKKLSGEHQILKAAYERVLKEKNDADERLSVIQQQWETFMRGV
ncbi:hypothetical protein [Candidatus Magnetominusculus dajiuhuensis]|uniref:hypothetical protein n=1 Tax=Candidatus Magnetominusculus dajiuhuensis TaxID=3137712 RepID=UPI003B43C1C9